MEVAIFFLVFLGIPALVTAAIVKGDVITRRIAERRLVTSVERVLGHRSTRTSWARLAAITVAAWITAVLAMLSVSPTLAVWLGGLVVVVGAGVILKVHGDPHRLDDHEFDRRLRDLLDRA